MVMVMVMMVVSIRREREREHNLFGQMIIFLQKAIDCINKRS